MDIGIERCVLILIVLFGKSFILVILEAFWLPLGEQRCKNSGQYGSRSSAQVLCQPARQELFSNHHVQCAVFPRKLEHFVRKALFHDKVSCTTRKDRSWRVAAGGRLSHIHPWGWCSSKGCEGQEASPVQCYWEKSCWQDKQKNRVRISSQLGPPFLPLASTSSICIQILGKLMAHEDFLPKSLQKHGAVVFMDGCFDM